MLITHLMHTMVTNRHLARLKYSKAGVAATKIQVAYRAHLLRQSFTERIHQARRDRDSTFQTLQQQLYQQWPLMQRHTHVVVHVPSLHRSKSKPGGRGGLAPGQVDARLALEAAQLARLCDLAEPLVEVLLLLPGKPDEDVLAYWDKILEVQGEMRKRG